MRTSPQIDFADARARHWGDAEVLFAGGRWANADHLYGLSAECGLKAVMLRLLGMADDLPPSSKYRKHVNDLWRLFEDFAQQKDGARYLRLMPEGDPFADWAIEDRYAHRSGFDRNSVSPHREAARKIGQMAAVADQDDA